MSGLADAPLHHMGILTRDLNASLGLYRKAFHYVQMTHVLPMAGLGIRACVMERPGAPRLELIEPVDPGSRLGQMALAGTTGYHLAWAVPSLQAATAALAEEGFHALPVFPSPLWEGLSCCFAIGPANELVELLQAAPPQTPPLPHENHPHT